MLFWIVTFIAALGAIGTAFWGWSVQYSADLHAGMAPSWVFWERIALRSLKALGFQDLDLAQMVPAARLPLGMSQGLGTAFAYLIASRILLIALGSRLKEMLLSFRRRGHDVIIGAGQAAYEYAAQSTRRTTHTAYDMQPMLGRAATLPRAGTLERQLTRAAADRANRIIVDEGDDAVTWETAQGAASLFPNVDVLAHIRDPWIHEKLTRASPAARLSTFSYASGIARQVMLAHPPYLLARRYKAPAQHILIFGFGAVGQALAREFLVTSLSVDPQPMIITAVDPNIADRKAEFLGRLPGLGQDVSLNFIPGNMRLHDSDTTAQLKAAFAPSPVCAIYVAIDSGSLPLSFGLDMRDRARELGLGAPIFICAQHGAGLSQVSQGSGMTGQGDDPNLIAIAAQGGVLCDLGLVSFGTWGDALDGSGLFEPRLDGRAKIFHEVYLMRHPPSPGQSLDSARVKWEQLSDEFRVANRRAAAHIRAKADAAGYDLEAWLAKGPPPGRRRNRKGWRTDESPPASGAFKLDDPAFLDRMADLEHRRWLIDRALNGWKLGARDNRLKLHPMMIPTKDLPEAERQKDRSNVAMTADILKMIAKRR
jgi:voltage-gated potassium channel Kch